MIRRGRLDRRDHPTRPAFRGIKEHRVQSDQLEHPTRLGFRETRDRQDRPVHRVFPDRREADTENDQLT